MNAEDFPHSPEQVTLTHQWLNTKKHGRDDQEIEATKLKVVADRKAAKSNKRTKGGATNESVISE